MKKIVLLMIIATSACNPQTKERQTQAETTKDFYDSTVYYTDKAKIYFEQICNTISEEIKGNISHEEAKKITDPIQAKFDAIYNRLPPDDTMIVHNFQLYLFNNLIDTQIKYHPEKYK